MNGREGGGRIGPREGGDEGRGKAPKKTSGRKEALAGGTVLLVPDRERSRAGRGRIGCLWAETGSGACERRQS